MMITARQACRVLAGAGVSKRCALAVLASGLAGEAVQAGPVVLYEHDRVAALARRPVLPWSDVDGDGRAGEMSGLPGLFVSRRPFPATASRPDQLAALSGGWSAVSPWRWVAMAHRLERHGSFPFVATVGGLVVLGADIVEVRGLCELVLAPPGPWFEVAAEHWLPTGRGRPWVLHLSSDAA